MFFMTPEQVERVIRRGRLYFLIGFLLLALNWWGVEFGIGTSIMALWLGASAASLEKWQTERGLWMLSALFLLFAAATWLFFMLGQARDFVQQRAALEIIVATDLALATMLLGTLIRFLAAVTRINWTISKPPKREGVE